MSFFLAVALKGLLLITSEPAGASITYDGYFLGETPRLVTVLEADKTHRLQLEKKGYQPRFLDVKFQGRTPLAFHEKLILDSGTLNVTTQPAGAKVLVNGLFRGKTPLTVSDIPKGRATIKLDLEGYYQVSRELSFNASDVQDLAVNLEGMPGKLHLFGAPEGVRFYVNGIPHGESPAKMENLKPGVYTIRAVHEQAAPLERTIVLAPGQTRMEEFRLTLYDQPQVKAERPKSVIADQLAGKVCVRVRTDTGVFTGLLTRNGEDSITIELPSGLSRSFPRAIIKSIKLLDVE